MAHPRPSTFAVVTALSAACATPSSDTAMSEASYEFASCGLPYEGAYATSDVSSVHVSMRDGVRIALDVVLPEGLAEGERADADITVFDPETVIDRSTYMDATIPAAGIPYVIVGGEVVVDRGELTGARPGEGVRAPIR